MSIILSLLGLGGGMAGLAAHFLFPNLFPSIWTALGKAPKWLIYGAIGLIAAALIFIWHGHEVKQVKAVAFAAGEAKADKDWQASFDQMRDAERVFRNLYQQKSDQLNQRLGAEYAQDLRDNAARADDLRLRGPGKARGCVGLGNPARLAEGRGGSSQPSAPGPDAPGPEMPANDGFAVVPWGWLVQRAREHDDLLAEVIIRREWYTANRALYDKSVADLRTKLEQTKPEFGKPQR